MTPPEELDVWVMAGQSNMEGCGALREALPPDPRVWSFYSKGCWGVAQDPLHDLVDSCAPVDMALRRAGVPAEFPSETDEDVRQYHRNRTRGIGAGLGIAFGSAVANVTGRPVGLIAAAHGGTSLGQWSHEKKNEGMDSLYGAMLERIRMAGGNLKGILWYQGESDAGSISVAESYRQRLTDWITAVRADTGRPNLPVLVVQLGRHIATCGPEGDRSWNLVQYALTEIPDHVPHTAATGAVDLGMNDGIHLSAPGQIRLGRRLARLALRVGEGMTDYSAGPHVESLEILPALPRNLGVARLRCSGVTGAWLPEHDMAGFSVLGPDWLPHKGKQLYAANRDHEQPNAILIYTEPPLVPGDVLVYGYGRKNVCNVHDQADMPLCTFAQTVEG